MRWLPRSTGWLSGLLLLITAWPALAQQMGREYPEYRPATRTFAITNAQIVQAPGRVINGGIVVIRDGLIESVGVNADPPFDARVIEGDTLYVYAGFIDGLSHAGIPRPREERDRERPDRPGDPPYDRAGIRPERRVPDLLVHDEGSIENLRKLGFATAHVVPHGQMLPGQGALVQLTGRNVPEMILRDRASMFAQFETARGVYPATTMAIMARWRQIYREADRRQGVVAARTDDPAGIRRLEHDSVHDAFYAVVNREQPVVFRAETSLDARRAIRLSEELGFRLVLAGLKESWYITDELRDNEPPVFLSLDLPEENGRQNRDTTSAQNGDRVRSYTDLDDERSRLEERREQFRDQYIRNAAELHQAGVRFGFATVGTEHNKIRKNLRKIIEHGLPEDAALSALTVNAAQILGVGEQLGTVEPGKIANLVVTTAPYFEEDSQVRMVFIDGRRFDYEVRAVTDDEEDEPDAEVTPVGTWDFMFESPDGPIGGTLVIQGSRGAYTGVLTLDIGTGDAHLRNIALDGSTFTFDVTVLVEGQTYPTSFSGTLRENTLRGSATVPGMGTFPASAERRTAPDS